jgi:hypothetical protein
MFFQSFVYVGLDVKADRENLSGGFWGILRIFFYVEAPRM